MRRSYSICTPPVLRRAHDRGQAAARRRVQRGRRRPAAGRRHARGDDAGRPVHHRARPDDRAALRRDRRGLGHHPGDVDRVARCSRASRAPVMLVYANRTSRAVMFLDEVHDLKDRFPERLQLLHVLSREAQDVELFSGRLDGDRLRRPARRAAAGDAGRRVVPVRAAADGRGAARRPRRRGRRHAVHTELFHADPVPRAPVAALADGAEGAASVTVRLDGRASDFSLRPDDVRRARGGDAGALRRAVRLQGRRVRHLPRPAGRGHGGDGRQLRPRARGDRAAATCSPASRTPTSATVVLDYDALDAGACGVRRGQR